MLVVADTSSINYLILLNQDALLPQFYDRVVIPPAVQRELQHRLTPQRVREWVAHPPAWFEVRQPQQRLETHVSTLGAGSDCLSARIAGAVTADGRSCGTRRSHAPRLTDDRDVRHSGTGCDRRTTEFAYGAGPAFDHNDLPRRCDTDSGSARPRRSPQSRPANRRPLMVLPDFCPL